MLGYSGGRDTECRKGRIADLGLFSPVRVLNAASPGGACAVAHNLLMLHVMMHHYMYLPCHAMPFRANAAQAQQ